MGKAIVIVGDGELQEGLIWESIQIAGSGERAARAKRTARKKRALGYTPRALCELFGEEIRGAELSYETKPAKSVGKSYIMPPMPPGS